MSIPFFFRPVRHDVPAATFEGVSYPAGTVTWVDGGLLSNFPVEVFDRSDGSPARWPTLGIKLSARQVVVPPPRPEHSVLDEALACVRVAMDNADRYYLTPAEVARTIFVDTDARRRLPTSTSPPSSARRCTPTASKRRVCGSPLDIDARRQSRWERSAQVADDAVDLDEQGGVVQPFALDGFGRRALVVLEGDPACRDAVPRTHRARRSRTLSRTPARSVPPGTPSTSSTRAFTAAASDSSRAAIDAIG